MNVLISGILLFASAFLLHLLVWRLRYPKNPIRILFLLFGLVILSGTFFLFFYASYTAFQCLYVVFLFSSLFICYLITYSAIEADSPSLVIMLRIAQAGKKGLPFQRMKESLGNDLLVQPRLRDLVDARLVDLNGPTYKINKKGKFFIRPFVVFRDFLGLSKGG